MNGPYRRRLTDPTAWPSNQRFAQYAVERTRQRVNDLSWELAGHQLADEIEQELQTARRAVDLDQRRARRAGDPGE